MKVNTSLMLVYIILDICFVNKSDIIFFRCYPELFAMNIFFFFNILMQSILDYKPISPRSVVEAEAYLLWCVGS